MKDLVPFRGVVADCNQLTTACLTLPFGHRKPRLQMYVMHQIELHWKYVLWAFANWEDVPVLLTSRQDACVLLG